MASKKDNRRMVDMLERMGMIKKDEEAQPEVEAAQPDAYNQDQAESRATQSAVIAVPEQPGTLAAPLVSQDSAQVAGYSAPEAEKNTYSYGAAGMSYEKRSSSAPSPISSLNDSFWDDAPEEPEPVERYLEIDELYNLFQMQISGVDTVYLLEEYIKTLPDSLPADLRRSIIVRIVQASGFDFDKLLADGIDRVSRLNDYASEFAVRTDAIVTQQNDTIAELERQIELVHAVINERKNLHKKQFLSIENEAQRLKKILDFITK